MVPPSIDMVTLLGPRDTFLRVLEDRLSADLHVRGGQVTLTGDPEAVAAADEVLTELITIIRTGQGLTEETVERVIGLTAGEVKPSEILTTDIISARAGRSGPKRSTRSATWTPSTGTRWFSGSARQAPARHTWPWPRRYRHSRPNR